MNVNLQPQFGIVKQYGSRASDQSLENFRANLKVGDSVSGRVLRQVAGNRFLVAFDGLNIIVFHSKTQKHWWKEEYSDFLYPCQQY